MRDETARTAGAPPERARRHSRESAFTIIELMITLGILGILTTIAIPALLRFQLRTKLSEVKGNLAAIRVTQESYLQQHGTYVSAVPMVPATVGPTKTAWPLSPSDNHGFNFLGFAPEGAVYFQYGAVSNGAASYTIEARSDIDGDGVFNIWGYVKPPLGTAAGNAGPLGVCPTTGVYDPQTGLFDGLTQIGACDGVSGRSVF